MTPSPGQLALLACVWEVTAPKVGNVHPHLAFEDATWADFVLSASVTREVYDRAPQAGVGRTVLDAVRVTRQAVGHNTNLGMILLIAPLAAVPAEQALRQGVARVPAALDERDAATVYEAIRLAQPGGLGEAEQGDVRQAPTLSLLEAMRLAADRDAVARQYVTDFATVFDHIVPDLIRAYDEGLGLDQAIVLAHLRQMAREPDSLIARKVGAEAATLTQQQAQAVVQAGYPHTDEATRLLGKLDAFLRRDGHRLNPGTSADLIAAGLYAALRMGMLPEAPRWAGPLVTPDEASV